jgi:WD40 repeat protein
MKIRLAFAALLVTLVPALPTFAQQFGQNKIVYGEFRWKVYSSPHFNVHYYGDDEVALREVVSYAESAYLKISKVLDHELASRVPLITYRTHSDFEQTNITMGEIPQAVGAFAEPIQNRMVVPIDQPPDKLYALIAHELTHIFQYSIFYEGYIGRAIRANPPLWLMEGMASYIAEDEDSLDRMAIRDAVVNNILPPVQELSQLSFLTYRFGHAVFDFIEGEFGKEGLRNFIFEYRKVLLSNNLDKAVKDTFGVELPEFNRKFNQYLRKKYFPVLLEKKSPEDYGKEVGVKKEGVFTFSPTLSPSGELIAALASPKLELDLVVLSAEGGTVLRNLTKGWTNRYEYLVTSAFEGKRDLSWSPTGDHVAVFAQKENSRRLLIFDAISKKLQRMIELPNIAQAASPAFSPDGGRIAFEGNRDGIVDLFEIDLATRQIRNLTQDEHYDANPCYSADGRSLLYNRRVGRSWKVFTVDLADPSRKTQLTFGTSLDIQPSYSRDGKRVFFSSDRGLHRVFNIHVLDLGTGEVRQLTDVVGGCFQPVEMAERGGEPYLVFVAFFEGTFRLYRMPAAPEEAPPTPPPGAAGESAEEEQPFEPALDLTLDREAIRPYKVKWSVEAPYVSVGVTNDGTFLADAAVQFTDLLGDQRIQVLASSLSTYTNIAVAYVNLKRRLRWGANLFDFRDYFVTLPSLGGGRDQQSRTTGGSFFIQYPFNRYYRADVALGLFDRSQDYFAGVNEFGFLLTRELRERYTLVSADLTGDTTRYQQFGPFQGKRFNVGVTYGIPIGGDVSGNILEYRLDYRAYAQLSRRSLIAWRLAGVLSQGGSPTYYSLGGINQLRGFGFREYFGSRVAWSNLELRYPLVDEMRFPFLAIRSIRGFLFLDVGAAWFENGGFYDPALGTVRVSRETGAVIPFKFWDSDNNRLQDGRASFGAGFQFLFMGGLQFNWSWAWIRPYTQYLPRDPTDFGSPLVPVEISSGGPRADFYIVFDF